MYSEFILTLAITEDGFPFLLWHKSTPDDDGVLIARFKNEQQAIAATNAIKNM